MDPAQRRAAFQLLWSSGVMFHLSSSKFALWEMRPRISCNEGGVAVCWSGCNMCCVYQ